MPNIKSAKKRVSVIERRKQENRYVKSTMATMIKNFRATVKVDTAKAEAMLKDVISYIDSAQTKGVIHKNNASRKVARLNTLLYKAKGEVAQPEVKVEAEVAQEPVAVEEKPAKKTTKRAAKKTEPKAE